MRPVTSQSLLHHDRSQSLSTFASAVEFFLLKVKVGGWPNAIAEESKRQLLLHLHHGYPSTRIFLYFQILATYFWLYLYVLTVFFRTCKYPSPEYSKYFESTKNLYVCERFLKQIQHILCTPVTLIYITGCLGDGASRPWQLPMKHDDYCCCWRK